MYRYSHNNGNRIFTSFFPPWAPADPSGNISPRTAHEPQFSRGQPPSCTPYSVLCLGRSCHCCENTSVSTKNDNNQCCRSARLKGQSRDGFHAKVEISPKPQPCPPGVCLLRPTGAHTPPSGKQLQYLSLDHL